MAEANWYVIHTYSGYENNVKTNIEKSIENLHLEDQILDVQVPMDEVTEVRNGQKKICLLYTSGCNDVSLYWYYGEMYKDCG